MGRVRGVVLQRLSAGRALILTRTGAFCEVYLGRRALQAASVGAEVEGLAIPRALVATRVWLQVWPRAAVATAVAFGTAGALFAFAYLRFGPAPGGLLTPEQVAGAGGRAGSATAEMPAGTAVPARPVSLSWRLQPPSLSGEFKPGEWASVRLAAQDVVPAEHAGVPSGIPIGGIGEVLRRALVDAGPEGMGPAGSPDADLPAGDEGLSSPPGAADSSPGSGPGSPAVYAGDDPGRSGPHGARRLGSAGGRGEARAGGEGEAAAFRQLAVPSVRRLERSALRWP